MKNRLLTAALASTLGLSIANAQVITVDKEGGGDFDLLQSAIDAASSGDLLLLREGIYANFTIQGKGISLVADEGATVIIASVPGAMTNEISGVPAGELLRFRGLTFSGHSSGVDDHLLRIEDCDGTVWFEDSSVSELLPQPFGYTLTTDEFIRIEDCEAIVLAKSNFFGGPGDTEGNAEGTPGLHATDSNIYLFRSTIQGGRTSSDGGTGAAGAVVDGGLMVLRDASIRGAEGRTIFSSPIPQDGGPGLILGSGGEFWSIGSFVTGGDGAFNLISGETGATGPQLINLGGVFNEAPAIIARLTTNSVVRDDAAVDDKVLFEIESTANSAVFMLLRLQPSAQFVPAWPDLLAVGFDSLILPLGSTDAMGMWEFALDIPTLPASLPTWNATVQMAVISPVPNLELSNPSIFTVVDEVY